MEKMSRRLQEAKALPTNLFVQVQVDNKDAAIIPQIMQTIQVLGITNYGIALGKDLYSYFSESNIKIKVANGMLAGIGG
jgi:L-rhamnose mutarotase